MKEKNTKMPKEFEYERATGNRLVIPSAKVGRIWYESLVSNGFLKLYTLRGRAYWIAQVTSEHKTPDWKIHFSIPNEFIPQAWNLIVQIVLNSQCHLTAMKAIALNSRWPITMKGREITIYLYRYDSSYGKGLPVFKETGKQSMIPLCKEDEKDPIFWTKLIKEIESNLMKNNIPSGGCADGDFSIGKYASLRNEAYVLINNELMYPPNDHGWNAVKHTPPFSKTALFFLHSKAIFNNLSNKFRTFIIILLMFFTGLTLLFTLIL